MHTQLTLIIATKYPEVYALAWVLSNSVPNKQIKYSIADERLRQARYSFNMSIIATTISFFACLTGAGLLMSNKLSQGSVTAASGLVSSALFVQLAKDANDRLDKILADLDDET
ncbi:hypothetical protein G7B40_037520 [Aetokthonos hydrillicola Thurmond2011]|jgi:hypothetical protein|uniref:Cyanobacterial TRADD-N associated 2 transmembrane domain-containing protein n=1 Tax=Aetokthonos hydrillicola Thurmond2011 TaxID=2712845 RepID=A0AAP5II42_9CYAN|nr:hypothetical protein [Aetokthonos hydrillicola]MDR9900210.1 hypothetical protein [Aetokthonos hydrillicola Thurmond2011]